MSARLLLHLPVDEGGGPRTEQWPDVPQPASLAIRNDASLAPSGAALARVSVLASLQAPRLDALAARCHWRRLVAWESLVVHGAPGDAVHLLVAGRLRVSLCGADGRQLDLRDIEAGGHCGEVGVLSRPLPRASVVALCASLVATVDGAAFRALMLEQPQVALCCAEMLAAQVRQMAGRLSA